MTTPRHVHPGRTTAAGSFALGGALAGLDDLVGVQRLAAALVGPPRLGQRNAFALAFDLAVRRDPLQSLWVPLLLHAPWLVASMLLPVPSAIEEFTRGRVAMPGAYKKLGLPIPVAAQRELFDS